MNQININDAGRNLSHWIEQLNRDKEPLFLISQGQARAVLLDIEQFQTLLATSSYAHSLLISSEGLQLLPQAESTTAVSPNSPLTTQQQGQLMAQQVRLELGDSLGDSLDFVMSQLRGREWLL